MKVLLFGRDGQAGWELQRALAPIAEVTALGRSGEGELCGDLTDREGLADTVRSVGPDAIVNAAAYTAVDRAESEPELARTVNADAPGALARVADEIGAALIHYSTDYVFDGAGERPWQEEDAPNPLNVYGRTKLEGEEAIRRAGCPHLILRTSWVYAARGKNFIRTMLALAEQRDGLQVIDDQHGAPTGAELLADTTAQVLPRFLNHPELGGTYHLTARGETTWHGYARLAVQAAREAGCPIRVSDEAIAPVATEVFQPTAERPRNSRLATDRLEKAFGLALPRWEAGVRRALAEILACRAEEPSQ